MRVLLLRARRPDHGMAQVALAAQLPAEGLVPVTAPPAEVAVVFDPQSAPPAPPVRVALVDALEPPLRWREAGERFAVVDEGAANVLSAMGIPAERIVVTGWPIAASWAAAAQADREELRARFGLDAGRPVVLVDTRELGDKLPAVIVQLGLADAIEPLFDAPDDATAAQLRARCPAAGIRARRFGESTDAPLLWRAADLVIGRPRPQLIARARAVGLAVVALSEPGVWPEDLGETDGVAARGMGRAAGIATLAAELDILCAAANSDKASALPLPADGPRASRAGEAPRPLDAARAASAAGGRLDAARAVARLCLDVARRRDEILAEPRVRPAAPAGALLEEVGVSAEDYERNIAERAAERAERDIANKEIDDRLAALKARLKRE